MIHPLMIPVKIAGLVVAGLAFGAGWKVGAFIGDVAAGEKTVEWPSLEGVFGSCEAEEPLWKRKFGPVSEG